MDTPYIVVCPHCNKEFVHNKVNGMAIIEAVQNVETRKRMYCRLALDALERDDKAGKLTFANAKKILLDNMNDLARDVHTIIGFGRDVE
jgi:hypothetical protein